MEDSTQFAQFCYGKKKQLRKRFFCSGSHLDQFLQEHDLNKQRKFSALATRESCELSRTEHDVALERARSASAGSTKHQFYAAVAAFLSRDSSRDNNKCSLSSNKTSRKWQGTQHHSGHFSDSAAAC